MKAIPIGSKLIQDGLYLYEYSKVVSGKTYTFWQLYSAEGWHFYDKTQTEYDEEGNAIETERNYAQFAVIPYGMDLTCFVSVRVSDVATN